MRNWIVNLCKAVWRHRVTYAGLAIAYGCGCTGWLDKDTVAQIVTALYALMVTQKH